MRYIIFLQRAAWLSPILVIKVPIYTMARRSKCPTGNLADPSARLWKPLILLGSKACQDMRKHVGVKVLRLGELPRLQQKAELQERPARPARTAHPKVNHSVPVLQDQGLHLTAKIQDRGYVLGSLRLKPWFETEPELYFILRSPKTHGFVWSSDRFNCGLV